MDDLVERLRDWPYQGETMAHLAADEIAALRARLEAVEEIARQRFVRVDAQAERIAYEIARAERAEAALATAEQALQRLAEPPTIGRLLNHIIEDRMKIAQEALDDIKKEPRE